MAEQEVWIGSNGPFLYDDADQYPDSVNFRGVRAQQIYVSDEPMSDNEVLRYGDIAGAMSALPAGITAEGGFFITLYNKTGSGTYKGMVVAPYVSQDESFTVVAANGLNPIGITYDVVADGELCRVVVAGIAEVLIEDGTAAYRGYWVKVSDTQSGRANATNILPPGGTIAALEDHNSEIGHCIQNAIAGTNVLVKIVLHFN